MGLTSDELSTTFWCRFWKLILRRRKTKFPHKNTKRTQVSNKLTLWYLKMVFGIWISNSVHTWFFIGFWCDQYNWFVWWQHHVYWFQKSFRFISMNFILYVNLNGQNLDGQKYPIGHMFGFSKSKICTQFHIS